MTKTLTITYGVNPTKAEEIAIIAKLVEAFKGRPDMFLSDLFRPELIEYAKQNMDNDFPPDVIAELRAERASAADLEARLKEANLTTESADRRAKMWESTCAAKQREFEEEQQENYIAIRNAEARDEMRRQALIESQARVAELEANELKLKAHLYDLMTAAAAK